MISYETVSKLPPSLDKNRDGKLDDVNIIANNIKADLLNPNKNAQTTLNELRNAGWVLNEAVQQNKEWEALGAASKKQKEEATADFNKPNGYSAMWPKLENLIKGPQKDFISAETKKAFGALPQNDVKIWISKTPAERDALLMDLNKLIEQANADITKEKDRRQKRQELMRTPEGQKTLTLERLPGFRKDQFNALSPDRQRQVQAAALGQVFGPGEDARGGRPPASDKELISLLQSLTEQQQAQTKQQQDAWDYANKKAVFTIPVIKYTGSGRVGGSYVNSTTSKIMTKQEYDTYMRNWNKADSTTRRRMSSGI